MQLMEQIKGGCILESNLGESFSKLCLSDDAAQKVKKVIEFVK